MRRIFPLVQMNQSPHHRLGIPERDCPVALHVDLQPHCGLAGEAGEVRPRYLDMVAVLYVVQDEATMLSVDHGMRH